MEIKSKSVSTIDWYCIGEEVKFSIDRKFISSCNVLCSVHIGPKCSAEWTNIKIIVTHNGTTKDIQIECKKK